MTSRDILQGSFLKFLWYVWLRVLLLPEPTRIQLDIARYLVGGPRRRFIQAFRGVGKTFITAAYVVWRLWKNPDLKVAIVSANEKLAAEITQFIKQIIDAPEGDNLWSELRPRTGQRQSSLAFDVGAAKPDKSPSVKAMSIVGQLTGSRADLTISDDVEVPKNSETETMREKLADKTTEYAAITKPEGEIVYLGTPQSEQSIYRGLPERGYDVRIWPARYPLKDKLANYGPYLAPLLKAEIDADASLCSPSGSSLGGAPTDPKRFHDLDLIERENDYRASGFLLQFQLDTTLSDAERFPLKTRDLMVLDVDQGGPEREPKAPATLIWGSGPEQLIKDIDNVGFDGDRFYRPMHVGTDYLPFQGAVMHIDPSGRGRDRTTYCVSKFLHGYVFVSAWGGFQDGYGEETLKALADISKRQRVNLIVPEDNFGDGMFGKLLETHVNRVRPCRIEGQHVHGMKEERIVSALEPLMRSHRLVIDQAIVRDDAKVSPVTHSGLFQLTHISAVRGSLKHDDMVDVLSMAAKHWAEHLNADASKAERDRAAKIAAEFERQHFSNQLFGRVKEARGVAAHRGRGRPRGRR